MGYYLKFSIYPPHQYFCIKCKMDQGDPQLAQSLRITFSLFNLQPKLFYPDCSEVCHMLILFQVLRLQTLYENNGDLSVIFCLIQPVFVWIHLWSNSPSSWLLQSMCILKDVFRMWYQQILALRELISKKLLPCIQPEIIQYFVKCNRKILHLVSSNQWRNSNSQLKKWKIIMW